MLTVRNMKFVNCGAVMILGFSLISSATTFDRSTRLSFSRLAARVCNRAFSAPSIVLARWFAPNSITNPKTTTSHQNPAQTSTINSCLWHQSKHIAHLPLAHFKSEYRLNTSQNRTILTRSNAASLIDISKPSPTTPQTTIQDPTSAIVSQVSDEAEWKNKNVSIPSERLMVDKLGTSSWFH